MPPVLRHLGAASENAGLLAAHERPRTLELTLLNVEGFVNVRRRRAARWSVTTRLALCASIWDCASAMVAPGFNRAIM